MTPVICKEDCGNAPKKALIRDFYIAAVEGDVAFLHEHVAGDIVWQRYAPGEQARVQGEEAVLDATASGHLSRAREIVIDHVLTHGKAGSANGAIETVDGERWVFCDVFVFSSHAKNAPIRELTTYLIAV